MQELLVQYQTVKNETESLTCHRTGAPCMIHHDPQYQELRWLRVGNTKEVKHTWPV